MVSEEWSSIGKCPRSSLGLKHRLVEKDSTGRVYRGRTGLHTVMITVDTLQHQHQDLELYAPFDWQPAKLEEHGSQVLTLASVQHNLGTGIMDSLKLVDQSLRLIDCTTRYSSSPGATRQVDGQISGCSPHQSNTGCG